MVTLSPYIDMLEDIASNLSTPEARNALAHQNLNEAHDLLTILMDDPPYDVFLKEQKHSIKDLALKCLEAIAHTPYRGGERSYR